MSDDSPRPRAPGVSVHETAAPALGDPAATPDEPPAEVDDYRLIQIRRTIVYIEQSIKNALNQFVFAPNNRQTRTTVTSTVSGVLHGVWSQGGLMGATASEAFTVQCGLGSTMTGQDVLDGYMIVQVTLQMIRPAEFIELTFKQTMEGVS